MICIVTIIDRGKANAIVDYAKNAGAKGATIFYGRGTGDEEVKKYFNFHIESSKEVILIISEENKSQPIIDAIVNYGKLNEPGKGILFTFPLLKTIGIS